MLFWGIGRSEQTDPKEAFPIEEMPLDVRGGVGSDDVLSTCLSTLADGNKLLAARRYKDPQEKMMRRLIPVLDAMDHIVRHSESVDVEDDEILENWFKAVTAVRRHLQLALEREGLSEIESLGLKVDLSVHDVVEVREDPNIEENNVIVEEIEKGYRYKDRVLRDARVIVARRPGE